MTIIIDPQVSGISGNMLVGAFVDLGADSDNLKEIMEKVSSEFGKIEVTFSKINKNGINSTYCNVKMMEESKVLHFNEFISKIKKLDLEDFIIEKSINVFKRIAISESKIHGKNLEEVHFHEVGSSDAVADVIGSIYSYYSLNLDKKKIIGLPISVGGGQIRTQHGLLPVPAPATLDILKGAKFIGGPVNSELATPTGCALYMELCDEIKEFMPMMSPLKIAYGAGSKDFNHPNVLRVILASCEVQNDMVDVIETNVDHLTGEEIGFLFDKLFSFGALDLSIIPTIMKKNRPGNIIKIIAKEDKREDLINILFKETGTLGIRISPNIHRGIAKREFQVKKVEFEGRKFEVTFKIAYVDGKVISKRPEFEDLKKIAIETSIPLKEVSKKIGEMVII